MAITVGQVSGIIAAAVFIIQLLFPNALVIVLACVLGNQHSAVTWSVVQRQLGNSLWPTILGSDTAASRGVHSHVRTIALLRPLGVALIALAAVVTPLGLYDAILPEKQLKEVLFTYLQDTGPMGYGTPSQGSDVYPSRVCGGFAGASNCPGGPNPEIVTTFDEDNFPSNTIAIHTYNISIPQSQIDLYTSGQSKFSPTVSSFYDIKSRQYTFRSDTRKNNGNAFPVDTFRMLNSYVLDDEVEAIQGLIIDMVSGGIGFRNHTLPLSIGQAAQWTEDLLWLEPVTECVDTNLTLEFMLPDDMSMTGLNIRNLTLVDNGGFANLIQKYPALTMDDNQSNPKLRERAYKAAWLVNTYSALILNVTRPAPGAFAYLNSELGKRFPLDSSLGSAYAGPVGIAVDLNFYNLVNPSSNTLQVTDSTSIFDNTSSTFTTGIYENPFDITVGNYSSIKTLCQGSGQADWANSSNVQVQCGLFFAAAQRVNGDPDSLVLRPNETWRQSVYSCASLNKVSLKTVALQYNATSSFGTSDLRGLTVLNVTDKAYASDKDMPLWGIEEPNYQTRISDIDQLWGIVDDNYDTSKAKDDGIALKRSAEMYLPGYTWGTPLTYNMPGYEYLPAAVAPKHILASTYSVGDTGLGGSAYDYTGSTNLAMFRRWQKLSRNIGPEGVPRILSLIWTDLAANTLQGSKGWGVEGGGDELKTVKRDGETSSGTSGNGVLVPVLLYRKRVCYHWVYAIPALVALGMFAMVAVAAMILSLLRRGPTRIQYYLHQLSAGRLLAAQHFTGQCEKGLPTTMWVKKIGREMIDLSMEPLNGDHKHNDDRKRGVYGGKEGANESTIEVADGGESYPLRPVRNTDRGAMRTGYVKMQEGQ